MTLENLIGKGLESEPADRAEIDRLLEKITTKFNGRNGASKAVFKGVKRNKVK